MVNGLDKFREHFAEFTDRYVLIGGTASAMAMEELGGEFRVTNDLDIVLCVEALDVEFAAAFWEFVRLGEYENRQKNTGKSLFYRFHNPTDKTFPAMLELFSRIPDAIDLPDGSHLTPIPVGDEVSSLSAILLDEDYYRFIHERKRVVHDLSVVGAECLIPLKGQAYLDLTARKEAGEKVDSTDVKKHKNDIFRLFTVLDRNNSCALPVGIRDGLRRCVVRLRDEPIDLKSLGIRRGSVERILAELEEFYGL